MDPTFVNADGTFWRKFKRYVKQESHADLPKHIINQGAADLDLPTSFNPNALKALGWGASLAVVLQA